MPKGALADPVMERMTEVLRRAKKSGKGMGYISDGVFKRFAEERGVSVKEIEAEMKNLWNQI